MDGKFSKVAPTRFGRPKSRFCFKKENEFKVHCDKCAKEAECEKTVCEEKKEN